MAITIREMTPGDIERVVEIISSHVPEDGIYARKYYKSYFLKPQPGIRRELNYVAASSSGEVMGVCGYTPDKYDAPGVLWLSWFYVDKDIQGGLTGYRLFEKCLDDIRALKTRKLYLDTGNHISYRRAYKFYCSAGFVLEGTLKDYFGEDDHMLIMSMDL